MNQRKILLTILLSCTLFSCDLNANEKPKTMNRLAKEKSPYLLQHAGNPVDWYPWGEEAFAKSNKENKPIFLSIGYSTCHWCHVMEEESFENQQIADILNEHFVPIKVDREERPDIDGIYMKAVMYLTGSGGWPMSLFLTPDKEPFAGGTYFPPTSRWGRPGFKETLLTINEHWQKSPEKVTLAAQSVTRALQSRQQYRRDAKEQKLNEEIFLKAYQRFFGSFDKQYGGFGIAPKFPTSHNLSFLLRYWKRSGNKTALEIVELTLQEMAKGGMYDQIGGGFHRYATERTWQIPHFEKMLYDQAILAKTYCEAYQATGNEEYAQIARDIFDYVLRDMRDQQGGFYSAEDADSLPPEIYSNISIDTSQPHKKSEGAFYIWTKGEIERLLGNEKAAIFNDYYGVKVNGNARQDPHNEFKGKNIIFINTDIKDVAEKFKMTEEEVRKILQESRKVLLSQRNTRPRPHLDDKILVDWNGLMISSFAFGARVLNEPRYQQAAEQSAKFVLKNLFRKDGRLLHRYRDGEAGIMGTLDDYAFFIHGLIDLYELTFRTSYLKKAIDLTKDMIQNFWDDREGAFYFTAHDAEQLLIREKEAYDGAIPSGNSLAALDLIRLARLTINQDWEDKAQIMVQRFTKEISARPEGFGQFLSAMDFGFGPSKEIVIAGDKENPQTEQMLKILYSKFFPNKVVAFRPSNEKEAQNIIALVPFIKEQKAIENQTTAYVCENHQCKKPTTDLTEFKTHLRFD